MVFRVDFKALVCCAVLTLANRLLHKHSTPLFLLLLLLELVPVVCVLCMSQGRSMLQFVHYMSFFSLLHYPTFSRLPFHTAGDTGFQNNANFLSGSAVRAQFCTLSKFTTVLKGYFTENKKQINSFPKDEFLLKSYSHSCQPRCK